MTPIQLQKLLVFIKQNQRLPDKTATETTEKQLFSAWQALITSQEDFSILINSLFKACVEQENYKKSIYIVLYATATLLPQHLETKQITNPSIQIGICLAKIYLFLLTNLPDIVKHIELNDEQLKQADDVREQMQTDTDIFNAAFAQARRQIKLLAKNLQQILLNLLLTSLRPIPSNAATPLLGKLVNGLNHFFAPASSAATAAIPISEVTEMQMNIAALKKYHEELLIKHWELNKDFDNLRELMGFLYDTYSFSFIQRIALLIKTKKIAVVLTNLAGKNEYGVKPGEIGRIGDWMLLLGDVYASPYIEFARVLEKNFDADKLFERTWKENYSVALYKKALFEYGFAPAADRLLNCYKNNSVKDGLGNYVARLIDGIYDQRLSKIDVDLYKARIPSAIRYGLQLAASQLSNGIKEHDYAIQMAKLLFCFLYQCRSRDDAVDSNQNYGYIFLSFQSLEEVVQDFLAEINVIALQSDATKLLQQYAPDWVSTFHEWIRLLGKLSAPTISQIDIDKKVLQKQIDVLQNKIKSMEDAVNTLQLKQQQSLGLTK